MRRRSTALLGLSTFAVMSIPVTAHAATPMCFGKPATIVGNAAANTLVGRDDVSDVIYGGGGNDTIKGAVDYYDAGTAPDLLCGGPGADVILGSPGPDKLDGGDGNDSVDGARGSDVTQGGVGDDRVIDRSHADMDRNGNDTLRGGAGHDYLTVALGLDKAYGDAGDDTIIDQECSTSYLYGGAGADVMESYRSSYLGEDCATGSKDYVQGNESWDRATVNSIDVVGTVEDVVRVS